jgi:hypothetical protein
MRRRSFSGRSPTASPQSCSTSATHGEIVTVRDGRIVEMVIYPTVADALAAAGIGDAPAAPELADEPKADRERDPSA